MENLMKWSALLLVVLVAAVALQDAPKIPAVGEKAPTFRLNDQTGSAVSVGANEDGAWSIVAFYPKAATPG